MLRHHVDVNTDGQRREQRYHLGLEQGQTDRAGQQPDHQRLDHKLDGADRRALRQTITNRVVGEAHAERHQRKRHSSVTEHGERNIDNRRQRQLRKTPRGAGEDGGDNRICQYATRRFAETADAELAVAHPFHRNGDQSPQDQGVEHYDQRDNGKGGGAEGGLGNRHAEHHVVGKHTAERENGLRHTVEAEQACGNHAADDEDNQATAKEGQQQTDVDRRHFLDVAHHAKQHGWHRYGVGKARQ